MKSCAEQRDEQTVYNNSLSKPFIINRNYQCVRNDLINPVQDNDIASDAGDNEW